MPKKRRTSYDAYYEYQKVDCVDFFNFLSIKNIEKCEDFLDGKKYFNNGTREIVALLKYSFENEEYYIKQGMHGQKRACV